MNYGSLVGLKAHFKHSSSRHKLDKPLSFHPGMLFVGIDLAWSPKNGSGIAILDADQRKAKVVYCGIAHSDSEILDAVSLHVKDKPAFIAIDAPLIVPNETGRRDAEKYVGMLFRKYDAGAHPSNRQRLSQWSGTIRGEEIGKGLEGTGFVHDPNIEKYEKSRKFFEVFPHPSMVVLFSLDHIIQYKAKPHRDYEFRWNEFKRYQKLLLGLKDLKIPEEIIGTDVTLLRSDKLKNYEDMLDGIFCAYIAYTAWKSPERCCVIGDMNKGYILTPVMLGMRDVLQKYIEQEKSQSRLKDF